MLLAPMAVPTPEAETQPPDWRTRGLGAVAALLVLIAVFHVLTAWHLNIRKGEVTDFTTFYGSARLAWSGENPYADPDSRWPYIYPPTLLWFMGPIQAMEPGPAVVVWTLLQWLSWLLAARLAWCAVSRGRHPPAWCWILPSLVAYRFVLRCTRLGQVDLFVLALVTAAFLALQRRRWILSAVALAGATVIKVLPVVTAVVFLGAGRRRGVLAYGIALGMWLALPLAGFGPTTGTRLLEQWLDGGMFAHATNTAQDNDPANQSLSAALNRLLADPDQAGIREDSRPLLTLDLETVTRIWMVLAGLLLVITVGIVASGRNPDLPMEGCLGLLLLHLVSRKTWETHVVTLVFIQTVFMVRGWCALQEPRTRWRGRRLLGASTAAVLLQNGYAPVFAGSFSDTIQFYSPTTLSLLLLWATAAHTLLEGRAEEESPYEEESPCEEDEP